MIDALVDLRAAQASLRRKVRRHCSTVLPGRAWVLMEPERNWAFAEMAVAETGLGNADDKVKKTTALSLMRDIKGVTAFGQSRRMKRADCRSITARKA